MDLPEEQVDQDRQQPQDEVVDPRDHGIGVGHDSGRGNQSCGAGGGSCDDDASSRVARALMGSKTEDMMRESVLRLRDELQEKKKK